MSKKMMKRSLALGALMAFVITGSAMAAEKNETLKTTGANFNYENGLTVNTTDYYGIVGEAGNTTINVTGSAVLNSTYCGIITKGGGVNLVAGDINIKAEGDPDGPFGVWAYNGDISLSANTVTMNGPVKTSDKGFNITISGGESVSTGAISIATNNTTKGNGGESITVTGKEITINAGNGTGAAVGGAVYGYKNDSKIIIGDKNTELVNITGDSGVRATHIKSELNITAKEVIITGKDGRGIDVRNSGEAYSDPAKITIDAENTKINMTGTGTAINAMTHGILNINGGLEVYADTAIVARGQAKVNVNEDGNGVVKINGDINFNKYYDGNTIHNNVDSDINLNLATSDSYFKGAIYVTNSDNVKQENLNTSKNVDGMNLTLSNGAIWIVTGDSFVSNLNVNDANIKLGINEDGSVTKVDVVNGTYTYNSLNVSGNGDVADAIAKDEDIIDQMTTAITGVDVNSITTDEGKVAGAYTIAIDADGKVTKNEAVNTVNKSIGEASVVGMAHIRAHMNDMNKRMGELRMANGESGVWTRMVRGEEEFAGAKSQYNQYQLGYDEKLSVDKRWTVGAAVTFAEGNGNFANGSTENDSTAFAIYGSKLNNDGTFVDLIARYARFESDITVADAKADYSTNGMSVSAEFGKRIQQGNGLWIEPQVELTYGSVDSAEYTIAGRNVQVGDMDSLIGRVGFSLGKDIKQGNVYARASYLYDFDGETETTFGNGNVTRTIAEDLGGGWWEVGVGANINLSKATYIYADVEKTFGGEVDTNWKWNLGVRYSF